MPPKLDRKPGVETRNFGPDEAQAMNFLETFTRSNKATLKEISDGYDLEYLGRNPRKVVVLHQKWQPDEGNFHFAVSIRPRPKKNL